MAKTKLDLFGDEISEIEANDFDALLKNSFVEVSKLAAGDRLRGEVLAVTPTEVFIASGTPTDAVMPISADTPPPKTGDVIDVVVMRVREGEILVRAAGSVRGAAEVDDLEDAFDMELPIEGMVTEEVKGGFRVKVHGQKAFCPVSQIDWRCTNAADYIGKKFEFIITKFERGRDLVVSRRRLLEMERALNEGEFLNSAEIGTIFSAQVVRLEPYGAFVRLENGIEGLVPISELSFSRIGHPQEVLNPDQVVQVKLIALSEQGKHLKTTFSLKQGGSVVDPWLSASERFAVGSQHDGVVEKKEIFGLFVSISAGVTGLLPRSAWRESTDGKNFENKRKGEVIKVQVASVDETTRRLSFLLAGEADDQSWRTHTGNQEARGSGFATFADLASELKKKR